MYRVSRETDINGIGSERCKVSDARRVARDPRENVYPVKTERDIIRARARTLSFTLARAHGQRDAILPARAPDMET